MKEFCQNLSPGRWLKEAKCTVLQRHISSTAARAKNGFFCF